MSLYAIRDTKNSFFTVRLHIRPQTHICSLDNLQTSTFMHLACSQSSYLTILVSGVSQLTRESPRTKKGLHRTILAQTNKRDDKVMILYLQKFLKKNSMQDLEAQCHPRLDHLLLILECTLKWPPNHFLSSSITLSRKFKVKGRNEAMETN